MCNLYKRDLLEYRNLKVITSMQTGLDNNPFFCKVPERLTFIFFNNLTNKTSHIVKANRNQAICKNIWNSEAWETRLLKKYGLRKMI
jgi:hypothetical protein